MLGKNTTWITTSVFISYFSQSRHSRTISFWQVWAFSIPAFFVKNHHAPTQLPRYLHTALLRWLTLQGYMWIVIKHYLLTDSQKRFVNDWQITNECKASLPKSKRASTVSPEPMLHGAGGAVNDLPFLSASWVHASKSWRHVSEELVPVTLDFWWAPCVRIH